MVNEEEPIQNEPQTTSATVAIEKGPQERFELTEDHYRTIFENSAVAITVTNKHEKIITWNKFAEVLLRMNSDDLYMRPVSNLYPEEEWKRIRAQNVRQKGIEHHFETRVIRRDQQTVDVDLSLSVLKGPSGDVLGSIGIIADISERKKAEKALGQSEELARGMIETASTGIYLVQHGRFIYANRLMEEILGYSGDELIGTYSIDYIHPDDRVAARATAIAALKGHSVMEHEFRIITKYMDTLWISERITSIEYAGNHAVLGTLLDVTERKIAEAASQERTRQLETLLAVNTIVGETLNLPDLLESVLQKVLSVMNLSAAAIFLVEGGNRLVLKAHHGFSSDFTRRLSRIGIGRGFAGRSASLGKPIVISKLIPDMRFDLIILDREGLQSLCSVPITAKGKVLGVMTLGSNESSEFKEPNVRLLTSISNQMGIVIENALLHEKTVEMAFSGELTGLCDGRYSLL